MPGVNLSRPALFAAAGILAAIIAAYAAYATGRPIPGLDEPQTAEAARATAQRYLDRAAGGDYAGAWDLLSTAGKRAVSRDTLVAYYEACPGIGGGVFAQVVDVRLETPTRAVANTKIMGTFAVAITVLYENGRWGVQPAPDQVARWAQPLEQQIAAARADGSCGG